MRGKITIDQNSHFMHLTFEPRASIVDWKQSVEAISRLSRKTGILRVLVDVRNQNSSDETPRELLQFSANIPDGIAFAVLGNPQLLDHKLVELAALNRRKHVRLFFEPQEEAIKWLAE